MFKNIIKLLTFRARPEDLRHFGWTYLLAGLFGCWLAGVGRYWDHPSPEWWQLLGLGSVGYAFILAAFLYLFLLPLRLPHLRYRIVLTFVALTSFPAILYAIPVERFASMETAAATNVGFLAVVATWRVALLFWFFKLYARLKWYEVPIVGMLPLMLIVTGLTMMNLEQEAFNVMAGITEGSAHGAAYMILFILTVLSVFGAPIFLLAYLIIAWERRGR